MCRFRRRWEPQRNWFQLVGRLCEDFADTFSQHLISFWTMDFTVGQQILALSSEGADMYHPAEVVAWEPEAPDTLRVYWPSRRRDAVDREADIPRSWVFEPDRGRRRRPPSRYRPEPDHPHSPPPRRARPRVRRPRVNLRSQVRIDYEPGSASLLRTFPSDPDYCHVVVVYTNPGDGDPVPVALEVGGRRYPIATDDESGPE